MIPLKTYRIHASERVRYFVDVQAANLAEAQELAEHAAEYGELQVVDKVFDSDFSWDDIEEIKA